MIVKLALRRPNRLKQRNDAADKQIFENQPMKGTQ
jgi:hypothetical protein